MWLRTGGLALALALTACHGATAPSSVVALHGARVIDGTGAPPIENATILVAGTKILAVGRDVAVPPGAQVLELAGKTVYPGLVSDHSHVGLVDGTSAGSGHYSRANVLRQLAQYEAYGVTTVTSLGMNAPLIDELVPVMHRGGEPGADLFSADRGIGVPAAAPPVDVGPDQLYRVNDAEAARAAVRETASRHPTFLKIWVDDFHGSVSPRMAPEIRRAILDEAHRLGLRVAAHVFYLDDARELVDDGIDVLAHGIRDRPVDDALIAAMKAHHTWYVPTIGLDESFFVYAEQPAFMETPFFRHALQPALAQQLDDPAWRAKVLGDTKKLATDRAAVAMSLANAKTLFDAGIPLGFGTDSGATPLRIAGFAEHHELALLTRAGIPPLAAIHLATGNAAKLLGLDDRGVIAAGKLADLVVVDGDPSAHIEDADRIVGVWHRGRKIAPP